MTIVNISNLRRWERMPGGRRTSCYATNEEIQNWLVSFLPNEYAPYKLLTTTVAHHVWNGKVSSLDEYLQLAKSMHAWVYIWSQKICPYLPTEYPDQHDSISKIWYLNGLPAFHVPFGNRSGWKSADFCHLLCIKNVVSREVVKQEQQHLLYNAFMRQVRKQFVCPTYYDEECKYESTTMMTAAFIAACENGLPCTAKPRRVQLDAPKTKKTKSARKKPKKIKPETKQGGREKMGYYIRVLSPSAKIVDPSAIRKAVEQAGLTAELTVETGDEKKWEQLVLSQPDGTPITSIERNPVSADSMAKEELEEFAEEIEGAMPESGANWLADYFGKVKTIYAFQLLDGTYGPKGWEAVDAARSAIHESVGGIIQADGEGFSNEEGYGIIWQFADNVKGPWCMAVLQDGKWVKFKMDLGNKKHREAFFKGEMPKGLKPIIE